MNAASDGAAEVSGETSAAPDADWHEWRRGGIGGSDAAALIGLSRYSSPYRLWAEKVGLLAPTETTPRQRVGQVLETAVAQLFHEETGLHVAGEQTWCEHPDVPILRCTVDGFVVDSPPYIGSNAYGTCEIKTDARFGWDELPDNIRAQVVWQLGVTGHRHAWIPVLHGGFRFHVYELEWDADAEADWVYMHDKAIEFWRHVTSGEPPMVDGSDATAATLAQLQPNHTPGAAVELDHLRDDLARRAWLKTAEADVRARLKHVDNIIKEAFADAEVGTVDGEPAVTYRSSQRAGYTVAPTTVRTLRTVTRKEL